MTIHRCHLRLPWCRHQYNQHLYHAQYHYHLLRLLYHKLLISPIAPVTVPPLPPSPRSVQQEDRNEFLEDIQQVPRNARTHNIYTCIQTITGKIFTDQTGQFLCPSLSGNKCLLVLYNFNENYIDAVPMPSRTKHQILLPYKKSTEMLRKNGFTSKL